MGHKGYYGQYTGNSKFSKKHDEAYDAKEAYNKDLTASARLHYLENDRHDHNSPAHQDKKMMVKKMACKDGYEMNENGECVPVKRNAAFKNIVGMGKKAAQAVESYKEARMQDPEEARYEEMSYQMDKKKRNAATQKHCMN